MRQITMEIYVRGTGRRFPFTVWMSDAEKLLKFCSYPLDRLNQNGIIQQKMLMIQHNVEKLLDYN